tara:strand:+ start:5861 stop:6850 length:990 start_codon:yes stop_codon:yes gene_type:complete
MKSWLLSHQQIFSNQFSRNILPHAILVNGVTGSGKLEFSHWLLHLLSCQQPQQLTNNQEGILQSCGCCKSCLLLKSNTYPDHLNLIAEKNSLGVDDIRHANRFLQKTAYLGKFKTVLIENAQTMTPAAANALLKSLEEPSNNCVIMLLTNDLEMLLPTVVSRCRVLNIRPNIGQALLQSMSGQVLNIESNIESNTERNNPFVNLTQLPELTDKTINETFQYFKACYLNYLNGQQVESQLLEQLLKNEHGLRWLEQITVNLLREQFIEIKGPSNMPVLSGELLNKVYKVIINGCKVIKSYTQANKQFVCEQLIMSISAVIEQTKMNEQET